MLTNNTFGKMAPMFLFTALAVGQTTTVAPSHHRLQIPVRPAALYTGEQGKQRTEVHYNPATGDVTLSLLVQDPAGYFIPDLHRENFAVFENGIRQQNVTVEVEHAPITLGIVMEHGGRYKGFNKTSSDEILRAGQMLLDEVGRNDKVAVWEYADTAQKVADFVTSHDHLDRVFMGSEVPDSSETNLYDALITTSQAMKEISGRKALVVVTTGADTFSKAKFADALEAVRTTGTPVYFINLGPHLRQVTQQYASAGAYFKLNWRQNQSRLEDLAQASGGRVYTPNSLLDLTSVYDDLMENLRVRYVVSYRSSISEKGEAPRAVRVELLDAANGGPLEIVDTKGKVIRSSVIVENSYTPSIAK